MSPSRTAILALLVTASMVAVALALVACNGGGEEPTASSSASGASVSTPMSVGSGTGVADGFFTYFNNDQGFVISYPKMWTEAELPTSGSSVVITGPRGSPQITVLVRIEEGDITLEQRMEPVVDQFRARFLDMRVVRQGLVTLLDGAIGFETDLVYTQQGLEFTARIQVVARGMQTYLAVATATKVTFDQYSSQVRDSLLSLALFVPSPEGVPADRTLFMVGADPVTLDPAISRGSRSHQYVVQLYSGLVRIDENLRIRPDLAESWSVEEGTSYTFTLREGITFHDGTPITAEDFKYSIERAADPALQSPTARVYLGDIVGVIDKLERRATEVSGVQVIGLRTLRITIDAPKAYFLAKLTYPAATVVDRTNVEPGGRDWWQVPNGSGPFKLKEWKKGEVLIMERYQGYQPQPSRLAFAVYRILAGVPMRMYEAGTVDVATVFGTDIDRALDPENGFADQLIVFPQLGTSYLGFNAAKPPFDEPKIRRAFAMAIDRHRLIEVVYQNKLEQARGILPPGMPAYNPGLVGIPFDPIQARRLIGESSYGTVEALPPLVINTPGIGVLSPDMAFVLEGWRQNLRVEVEVRQLTPEAYHYRLSQEVDHLFDAGWIADYPDPENFLDILFHSDHPRNNPGGYSNPQVDRLLEEARNEQDVARRMQLYQKIEQLLLDDAAAIPISHHRNYVLIKPYVQGFVIGPVGVPVLTNVELLPR